MTPVFVLGASRSGTSLLSSILLSSGSFAIYEAEPLILSVCQQKYGSLKKEANRIALTNDFIDSRQFRRSGLTQAELQQIVQSCSSGDYYLLLEKFMSSIAQKQNASYWSDSTPANIFYAQKLLKHFPNAKFIHVVRDGRDVALSKKKLGWTGMPSFLSNTVIGLMSAAAQWELSAKLGRKLVRDNPSNCMQVRYEDLVSDTSAVLQNIQHFLAIDLSTSLDEGAKYGSLRSANSSFGAMNAGAISSAGVGRWKELLSEKDKIMFKVCFSSALKQFGYFNEERALPFFQRLVFIPCFVVRGVVRFKIWLRHKSFFGRLSRDGLEIGLD